MHWQRAPWNEGFTLKFREGPREGVVLTRAGKERGQGLSSQRVSKSRDMGLKEGGAVERLQAAWGR